MKLAVKLVPLQFIADELLDTEIVESVNYETTETSEIGQLMLEIGIGHALNLEGFGSGRLAKRKFRLYSILRIPEVDK